MRNVHIVGKALIDMTYEELKEFLGTLTKEQLDQDVTIAVINGDKGNNVQMDDKAEYYPCNIRGIINGSDVLDDGHVYLGIVG